MNRRRVARKKRNVAIQRRRLMILAGLGVLGYAGLGVRAVQLQALDAEWLAARAQVHRSTVRLEPLRGEIHDRHGTLLAGSAEVESVAASPRRISDARSTAAALARALDLPQKHLRKRLSSGRSFVWIKRWATPEEADRVRDLGLAGVSLHPERKRFYPSGLAAAYLGFAGRDGEGLSGLELAFDAALRGSSASLPLLRNAHGQRLIRWKGDTNARAGARVVLTLDARLQHYAENLLEQTMQRTRARHATLVALDPWTGDLLAVAERPTFDPNRFWLEKPSAFRARAFVDVFEPGSTLKPFGIAMALDAGVVRANDRFDCEQGAWRVGDHVIHDFKPYGALSVHDIITLSSNIGAAKVAEQLGATRLVEGLRAFGFGQSTGSGFPGESPGILRPLRESQRVERANLAFGQGIAVTALQLAAAGATLANGGQRVSPRLVLRVEGPGGTVEWPSGLGERVLSESTARSIRAMLQDAVARGTGKAAALPQYPVAGKTGTAQKVVNGSYSKDRFVASFMGLVPAQNPRLVVVVVIDEPQGAHTGGQVAAPVFRELVGFALEQLPLRPRGKT